MARILLIDDHPAVRHGLGLVLSSKTHTICGEAGCISETHELLVSCAADIALLDLSLGDENGLDLVAALRGRGIATLVYSMHDDAKTVAAALEAGANGYVSKREMAAVLLAAIDDVLHGKIYLSPLASRHLDDGDQAERRAARDNALSEREAEVLAMLGKGESNAAIAARFAISVRTVETYFERIGTKLGIDGTKRLRRHAIRRRALDSDAR